MKRNYSASSSNKRERRYSRKMRILEKKMLNQRADYETHYLCPTSQNEDEILCMGKAILNAANQIGLGKSLSRNLSHVVIGAIVAVNSVPANHRNALEP